MDISEVKKNLNKNVIYKDETHYKLTACVIRKGKNGFFYQAELQDLKAKNSLLYSKLEDIGAIE